MGFIHVSHGQADLREALVQRENAFLLILRLRLGRLELERTNVTGHHIEVTLALKEYVTSKLDRLSRHFDHVTSSHVILTVEKLEHKAEATLNVNGATLYADAIEENMYAAIDRLVDRLDRQIKRHKEKIQDHRARDNPRDRFT